MFYYTFWKVWTLDGEIIFIASLSSLYDNKANLETVEHETGRSLIAR